MVLLNVGSGVEVDIHDEADTFWAAFHEHTREAFPDPEIARDFTEKFMDAHNEMLSKLSLEQLEELVKNIFEELRSQDTPEALPASAAAATSTATTTSALVAGAVLPAVAGAERARDATATKGFPCRCTCGLASVWQRHRRRAAAAHAASL
mmetsp:Transcript_45976/g.106162  ORF Transcript_45976/g.106162 Transcript_45976/m.106162 type:complete len:151 (-) Transcript_45976:165-617(-)|eukprot:CAMPEP_0171063940 /NCGR_PEP_ID=MMETSP0766_2-20121228/5981_1 /TAXON_ID=439317 /ORGANISM="Gambierdiscus australes, Strain CAWD 149" /LENGTH=150 /DNA_ID=CAMNT_0011519921 /DNA_START=27 /DNA_END=479 /DNA_ORIENTATION=-